MRVSVGTGVLIAAAVDFRSTHVREPGLNRKADERRDSAPRLRQRNASCAAPGHLAHYLSIRLQAETSDRDESACTLTTSPVLGAWMNHPSPA